MREIEDELRDETDDQLIASHNKQVKEYNEGLKGLADGSLYTHSDDYYYDNPTECPYLGNEALYHYMIVPIQNEMKRRGIKYEDPKKGGEE